FLISYCLLTPLVPSESYTYQLTVDPTRPQLINLYWKLINSDEIQFELHCQTTGYAALGLSPDGNMPNSDIVIGWIDSNGPRLFDTFATRKSSPLKDAQQDWTMLEAREVNGFTLLKLKRKLNTGDTNDIAITNKPTFLIFSWNNQDPISESWIYHGPNKLSIYTTLF
ncbi:DBH-like monooxygenase 1 -like protein, partial [Brachionus plicatilis]